MLKSDPIEVSLQNKMQLVVPKEALKAFLDQGHNRAKVRASFEDKTLEFHAAIKKYDVDSYCIYFSKGKQKELGLFINDYFYIQFFEDDSKYGVELPEELEAVLMTDEVAYQIFESFSPGKQRSLIYSILRLKNSDLRISKSLNFCRNIKLGITDAKEWLKPH
jgi:hypothetical protein